MADILATLRSSLLRLGDILRVLHGIEGLGVLDEVWSESMVLEDGDIVWEGVVGGRSSLSFVFVLRKPQAQQHHTFGFEGIDITRLQDYDKNILDQSLQRGCRVEMTTARIHAPRWRSVSQHYSS